LRLPSGADGGMQNSAGIFPILLSLGQMLIRFLNLNSWPDDFSSRIFPCSQHDFRRCYFIPFKEPHRGYDLYRSLGTTKITSPFLICKLF